MTNGTWQQQGQGHERSGWCKGEKEYKDKDPYKEKCIKLPWDKDASALLSRNWEDAIPVQQTINSRVRY